MSPDLAFHSIHTNKKKKKIRLDNFKRSINTNMIAPSNEMMSPSYDESQQSPITERKVKIKKQGGKVKDDKKKIGKTEDAISSSAAAAGSLSSNISDSKRIRSCHPYRDTIVCCMTMYIYISKALSLFCMKQCTTIYPYVYMAIPITMICELYPGQGGSKLNLPMLLVILIAINFDQFPKKSIRPFAVIFILLLLSIFLDFFTLLRVSIPLEVKILTTYVTISKILLGYHFIQGKQSVTTKKAKKVIWRRFRVFGIATTLPKRIMREIRNRLLGLEWIHFISIFLYSILFALSISVFSFHLSNTIEGSPINISMASFLMGKLITSLIVFLAMSVDTDIILWLAYFGCLGFCMKYVKEHIRKKKIEYGGWPVAYYFNETRFTFLIILKFADFVWGIIGWIIIGSVVGRKFEEMNDELRAIVAFIGIVVFLTDIWAPILFRSCIWLLSMHKKLEKDSDLHVDDSDDSELDDFEVRTPLNSPKAMNSSSNKNNKNKKKLQVSTADNNNHNNNKIEKNIRKGKYVESDSDSDNDSNNDSNDNDDNDDEESQSSPAKALFGKSSPMKKEVASSRHQHTTPSKSAHGQNYEYEYDYNDDNYYYGPNHNHGKSNHNDNDKYTFIHSIFLPFFLSSLLLLLLSLSLLSLLLLSSLLSAVET